MWTLILWMAAAIFAVGVLAGMALLFVAGQLVARTEREQAEWTPPPAAMRDDD
jgi:hypothetical protein